MRNTMRTERSSDAIRQDSARCNESYLHYATTVLIRLAGRKLHSRLATLPLLPANGLLVIPAVLLAWASIGAVPIIEADLALMCVLRVLTAKAVQRLSTGASLESLAELTA